MRAWSQGYPLLADDRLVVSPDGGLSSFPRRLRAYPDLARTAAAAHARFAPSIRRSLVLAGLANRLTRGWVGLPVLVPSSGIIRSASEGAVPLERIVIIERSDVVRALTWTHGLETALSKLTAIVDRDMAAVAAHDHGWAAACVFARARLVEIVQSATEASGAMCSTLTIPGQWTAQQAIAAVERELGLSG